MRPLISVCILAGHGTSALDACLASLRAQRSAPPFEVLVGGTSPGPELIATVHRHFPGAAVCDTGRRLPGAARNPLIERAAGELLLFLDDDVTAPATLLGALAQLAAEHPRVSVFGGPNETPSRSTPFQIVQGAVLSSLVGSGPVSRRYGARPAGPADERWFTLCNLAVRRAVMLPLANHLICAEENALLAALRTRGDMMRYDPRLQVFHTRRPSLRSFARQMFKYGRGRGELIRSQPVTARIAYLAPAALLAYLLILAASSVLLGPGVLMSIPGATYLVLAGASATRIGWTLRRATAIPLAALLTVTVHFGYGAGLLRGLLRPGPAREDAAARWTLVAEPVLEGAERAQAD